MAPARLALNRPAAGYLRLVVDAHVSLAYAVGAILDVKSGKDVEVEQRSNGREFWSPNDVEVDPSWPDLTFEEMAMGEGDLAVAIGSRTTS